MLLARNEEPERGEEKSERRKENGEMRKGRGERGNEKGVLLSFFGQALNNTSERSEVSIKRREQRDKAANKRAKTKLV